MYDRMRIVRSVQLPAAYSSLCVSGYGSCTQYYCVTCIDTVCIILILLSFIEHVCMCVCVCTYIMCVFTCTLWTNTDLSHITVCNVAQWFKKSHRCHFLPARCSSVARTFAHGCDGSLNRSFMGWTD